MKKILMSVLTMGAMTVAANAACDANGCYNVDLESIYIVANGDMLIKTSGNHDSLNCQGSYGKVIKLAKSNPGMNSIYSALLTAKTTNKKVNLRIVPSSSDCALAYYVVR